ncbi:Lrp/AsnC family transcriptional regulator [Paraburkholderia sp.]|uniref:Lrp/AsnC family transcriptional regulator n=1 Tax=Paraburkholderia sp. TaxID=1926495 RepID=UPI00238DE731|nr:Lrp/AsnC family transcriptional regulator [Paraburkholderia sp.]MDE1178963.1 Lrp/AsnC family transcriptional regulator [Paraburkholderia sp.]
MIDDRDRRILAALAANSRISFRDLGEAASLSANATAERVQRLIESGVISKFSIEIPAALLGRPLQAFIDVRLQPGTTMAAFEKALQRMEAVMEATVLTGTFDARLRIACIDPEHLNRIIEELRGACGVMETNSAIICRQLQLDSRTHGVARLPLK